MAKTVNPSILDQALNVFKTGVTGLGPANVMVACSAQPTNYTQAATTYMLASVSMASGDYTLGNGVTGGTTPRLVTMGAKAGVSITNSGTATYVALIDSANSVLLEVTTCTSQALTAGNTVTFPSWTIEIGAPT